MLADRMVNIGLIKVRFYIPPDTKKVTSEMCFLANLLAQY